MDQLTPEQVAGRSFRQAFRGFDPTEVKEFLVSVSALLAELTAQRDRLAGRLGDFADRDLQTEFAAVGHEVGQVLQAAQEAAEGMRDRASADAARWRSEALSEAETERRAAREDAEHLRSDAWVASEELLRQSQSEARRLAETAERDSLSILGEAEREAHRLTAAARRESDELTRSARMEAERLQAEAHARHDEIVEQARKQADASQERARALEQRRQELLGELETLRSSLSRMEGELDERRNRLGLSAPDAVPVETSIPAPIRSAGNVEAGDWEPGETVRVVSKRKPPAPSRPTADVEEVVDEVRRLRQVQQPPVPPLEPEPAPLESEPLAPSPEVDEAPESSEEPDELADIFSRLRGTPLTPSPPSMPAEEAIVASTPTPKAKAPSRTTDIDPFELYQRLVLPVSNRALRNLKRQLTEMQNLVLEEVRTSEGAWRPEVKEMESQLRPDLVVLLSEGFAMGHNAAEELAGSTLPRPPTPPRDEAPPLASLLAGQLTEVMEQPEESGRERASAISRVFRAWRTDEAERRVNDLAASAYNQGLQSSLAGSPFGLRLMVGGRGCARCREAAEADEAPIPPIHPGCTCTVVP
ncbi:MAG TPA: DivIVA domain-containing protein, partial [Vicinamibacteria bacterium]